MKTAVRFFLAVVMVSFAFVTLPSPKAHADADYSNTTLMDDVVLDNVNTMTEAQIQSFLTAQGPCLSSYTDMDPSFDGTNWTYGTQVAASHIIYKSAQQWRLNPQVILATLQKEESLVSGTSCDSWRYASAMGYACPDSGGCNPKYTGFTKQVLWGAWQLKFNKERSLGNTSWDGDGAIQYVGYMTQGVRSRCDSCTANYYDGNATIDGQIIHLDTGSTASLYTYTPHLGQSFPGIFEGWFGSVRAPNPPVPVYRVFNPALNNHLLTINLAERNAALNTMGYRDEGVAFFEYANSGNGLVPVYRLYSSTIRKHFYTTNTTERDAAVSQLGYNYEGIAFYAYQATDPALTPVYRLLDPRTGKHLWTIGGNERSVLTSQYGWIDENIGWYAAH